MTNEEEEKVFIGGFNSGTYKRLADKLEAESIDFRPKVAAENLRDIAALRMKAKVIDAEIQPLLGIKAGNPGQPKKISERKDKVLIWMVANSVNPLDLPRSPGRGGGDKGRCRDAMLETFRLFPNKKAFDNTWESLRADGSIGYRD
jgi:hypothetical protein